MRNGNGTEQATGTVWTVGIRGIDHTDLDGEETIPSTAGRVYWFDGGVVIQTNPTGFGDYNTERVIPWARVIEYRRESK